jgi:predicted dehydrogenase
MRIGILGTSDIAFRRFMPALKQCAELEYAGVASRDAGKTKKFTDEFGGAGYDGYEALLDDASIGCVYIPLPPALHAAWGMDALKRGKHVLMEKPLATKLADAKALVSLAAGSGLALHENYMFRYHAQIERIMEAVASGEIGEARLIRIDFGFPFKGEDDFRYDKSLGGGALLDCGGYALMLARLLLGGTAKLTDISLRPKRGEQVFGVDICGNAVLRNADGLTAQVSFGMDNDYRCSLDIWGSLGTLQATRIMTAPAGFEPPAVIRKNGKEEKLHLPADDTFLKSIQHFMKCVRCKKEREQNYSEILEQAEMQLSVGEMEWSA